MSRAKKPVRKKAAASKAAAARAERKAKKTITWKGVKFELPQGLPETVLFDMTDIQAAGENPAPVFRMLRSILGAAQFQQVRSLVEQGRAEATDIFDLTQKILEKYGVNQGES